MAQASVPAVSGFAGILPFGKTAPCFHCRPFRSFALPFPDYLSSRFSAFLPFGRGSAALRRYSPFSVANRVSASRKSIRSTTSAKKPIALVTSTAGITVNRSFENP